MSQIIGDLPFKDGQPLLKMWSIEIDERNRTFVRHSHTRFEITVVNDGSGEYTTESDVYSMEKGDVFVFSSNEVHCITKVGSKGLSITNLHFEPRYLGEDFLDGYIDFCFSHSSDFKNRIVADKAEIIRRYHNAIKKELLNTDNQYPLAVKSYLNLILIELLRNHKYSSEGRIGITAKNILAVYDYIDKNLEKNITLKELADIAGLTPNYFCSIFKKYNGICLWDYITAKRIEKAVRLIRNSDGNTTILDIALQCGFNNTVNFNKAFKKQKGITPRELQKNPKLLSH